LNFFEDIEVGPTLPGRLYEESTKKIILKRIYGQVK